MPEHGERSRELVQKACKETIRSIDKLDRESTGLMLFTNDEG